MGEGYARGTGILPVRASAQKENHVVLMYAAAVSDYPVPRAELTKRQGANLPHWTREGAAYAVTFRLGDSLPQGVLNAWIAERDHIVRRAESLGRPLSSHELDRLDVLHSERVDKYLDAGIGNCWMRRPEIAELVQNALLHFDAVRYRLIAWCIMPNHVHVVVQPTGQHLLPDILHSWKSFTSLRANQSLGRDGSFWQSEYYDHLIRDRTDLRRQIRYVMLNPIHAGLVNWSWVGQRDVAETNSVGGADEPSQDQASVDA
jgi:REP element-mobilizing transposase RayT